MCYDMEKSKQDSGEEVNHPDHYGGDTPYETIKVIEAKATREEYVGFTKWNAFKYLDRSKKKGSEIANLRKAQWYIDNLVIYLTDRPFDLTKLNERK